MRFMKNWRLCVLPLVFGIILAGCKLTGRVTTSDGDPIAGVTMQLSGNRVGETTTDANGEYVFDVPSTQAIYTITPTSGEWVFEPASRMVDTSEATQARNSTIDGIDFTGRRTIYTLTGRVTLSTGEAMASAKVTLSGDTTQTVEVDENGEYAFQITGDYKTYTLTPDNGPNFKFTPEYWYFKINADTVSDNGVISGFDFTGKAVSYSLIGYVKTASGDPLANVDVRLDIAQSGYSYAATDSDGKFLFKVSMTKSNYTITPIPDPDMGYAFDPVAISVAISSATPADDYNCIYGFDFIGIYNVAPENMDITYYHDCESIRKPQIHGGETDLVCHYMSILDGSPNGTGYWRNPFFLLTDFGASELYEGNFSIEHGRIGFYLKYIADPENIDILFCDSAVNLMNLDDPALFFTGLDQNGLAVQYGGSYTYFEGVIAQDTWTFVEFACDNGAMTVIIDGATVGTVTGVSEMAIPVSVVFQQQSSGDLSFDQILASYNPDRDLYAIRYRTSF